MSRNKLPSLNIQRQSSVESNEDKGSNHSSQQNARQRRRERLQNQPSKQSNRLDKNSQINDGFESDDLTKPDSTINKNPQKTRRGRKSVIKEVEKDETQNDPSKPPIGKKIRKTHKTKFTSHPGYLDGLEDDIIEMEEEKKDTTDQFASDLSQRELINDNQNFFKSVPTDNFFLEAERKFAIQKKELYEKRQNERLAQLFEDQLKLKQKEDLRNQISTGRTALYTHKVLRLIFLFFHGINVGFQFWQALVAHLVNSNDFKFNSSTTASNELFNTNDFSLLILFESLTMPLHCLSYFFLTICIVDTMDRVDFTRMNCKYFVKCLSFQNQFWSIIFYMIAVLISLSIIFIDQSAYVVSLNQTIVLNNSKSNLLQNISTYTTAWKSVGIVKAVFSLLGWLLFSIFVKSDKTCESLEKRDFTVLDDIAKDFSNQNPSKA